MRMGAQAAWISHSAGEEIEIEAPRVINCSQCSGLQCAFGEFVSRIATGFNCSGPSNRFIDKTLGRDDPINDAHALGGTQVVTCPNRVNSLADEVPTACLMISQ